MYYVDDEVCPCVYGCKYKLLKNIAMKIHTCYNFQLSRAVVGSQFEPRTSNRLKRIGVNFQFKIDVQNIIII